MNKLSAVFWDVDGTIADTELFGHRVAFNSAFKDYDLDWNWNESKYIELLRISGGLNRIINYRNEINSAISNDYCSKIQTRKSFHYKELVKTGQIKLRTGVLRLINELTNLNIEQFIVTTSGRESLNPLLNSTLHSHINTFAKIITYEDVNNHKPFPDAYNLAVKLSKQINSNCLAIEDSSIGVSAARSANINCLMTLPPWSYDLNNINKKANACVDSLGDDNNISTRIYGKELTSRFVDFSYLSSIIN